MIAAGRASEIVDLGGGRVLRRFKGHGDPQREASIMRHAREHGYPVPDVLETLEDALVLEFVDGPTMAARLRVRPWEARRHARVLAGLHDRLHAIEYQSASLVHFDLHPGNVLLSRRGPVVVDWTNARSGDPAVDVALTWVIGATSAGLAGRVFTRLFLREVDRHEARRGLPEAAELRLADPNVSDAERARVRRLLERA